MRLTIFSIFCFFFFFQQSVFAHPYWDPQKVPKDSYYPTTEKTDIAHLKLRTHETGIDVLRVQVDWAENGETYTISQMVIEPSGTPTLIERSKDKPSFGSYIGILRDKESGQAVSYSSIGTGKEYRKLTRAITLRFPLPDKHVTFELYAENPQSGNMEKVLSQELRAEEFSKENVANDVEIRELALASKTPAVRVNIYAEGYAENEKNTFWEHAAKTVRALQKTKFPAVENISFYGVFHASNKHLGNPQDLGLPIPERDSFLGLYYPYWDNFGRWYDIVYPTREDKFRHGLASAPYDYPIVLINSGNYWGVGNYMAFTAVPAANTSSFTYLLLHEFGHFFGLNEEYVGGGRTELEFAPDINEPWSQNITFLLDERYESLKWNKFVDKDTLLPTPDQIWKDYPPVYGAYFGGYADSSSSKGRSHKPGWNCVMDRYENFCHICRQAIADIVQKGQ